MNGSGDPELPVDDPPGESDPGPRADRPDDDFFRRLVRQSTDAVVTVDEEGRIVYANPAVESVFGHAPSDLVGRPLTRLMPERFRRPHAEAFARYLETGESTLDWRDIELHGLRADGTEVPLSVSFHVQNSDSGIDADVDADGERLFTGVIRELAERKDVERQLRREEERRDEIFEASPVALAIRTADGEVLQRNDRADELLDALGVEEGETAGVDVYDADGDPLTPDRYPFARVLETGSAVSDAEIRIDAPDAESRWFLVNATPVEAPDDGVEQVITAAKDITDVKRYQRELERERDELETELDDVFDRVTDAFFGLDTDWEFSYVNARAEELLGNDAGELLGRNIWEVYPDAVGTEFETRYRQAVETQTSVAFEEYFAPLETWFEVRAYPSETGLSVYFRDIGERKRREAELERQNERLESFASMLAHELRNPLNIAHVYLENAKNGDPDAFEQVGDALRRINEIIDVLLVLARGVEPVGADGRVALADVAADAWANLDVGAAVLEVETDRVIRAQRNHVQHLLENLFRNAVEHGVAGLGRNDENGAERGDPTVTIRIGDLPDAAGFYVEDDGRGIPEDVRGTVFEAGYSTDEAGIGLGLTFVGQLVDAYGWDCEITESEAGGARFEFRGVDVVSEDAQ
ncbi:MULTISPECIES: PAS domain-containing protein [Halorussus]|uniref:PAS domain-containing protein n=1 Tax=Halorussus TaxID=1070314 RepID=UPI0020A0B121|nr:PAS domain S-box protein [Halorussus vallis]USZ77549.1 PAS domain S-box protein [Halorussus vallis]